MPTDMVVWPTFLRKTGYYGLQNMDANVTIQIQNKRKEEFSTRILDDSKYRFSSRKKCATSNTISLHDKNLNRAIEISITFMYIFEANWSEGFPNSITKQIVIISWVGKPLKRCIKCTE